jgi:hypothetical protein
MILEQLLGAAPAEWSDRGTNMADSLFERPILNSPFAFPGQHREADSEGWPINCAVEKSRRSELTTLEPRPQKRESPSAGLVEMVFDANGQRRIGGVRPTKCSARLPATGHFFFPQQTTPRSQLGKKPRAITILSPSSVLRSAHRPRLLDGAPHRSLHN